MLVTVALGMQTHVVGIALKRTVILDLDLAGGGPAHEGSVELKRAVFDFLGIQSAVCGIVDIFEEETVHCRRNLGTLLFSVNCQSLGSRRGVHGVNAKE